MSDYHSMHFKLGTPYDKHCRICEPNGPPERKQSWLRKQVEESETYRDVSVGGERIIADIEMIAREFAERALNRHIIAGGAIVRSNQEAIAAAEKDDE